MTRKDYVLLAAALRSTRPEPPTELSAMSDAYLQWMKDCNALAYDLGRENGRFDRERFLTACGIE